MKFITIMIALVALISSCETARPLTNPAFAGIQNNTDPEITKSLFDDKSATISEEGIQKILAGNYKLPEQLRVAIVKLDNSSSRRYY